MKTYTQQLLVREEGSLDLIARRRAFRRALRAGLTEEDRKYMGLPELK